jgi:hypothetical protein
MLIKISSDFLFFGFDHLGLSICTQKVCQPSCVELPSTQCNRVLTANRRRVRQVPASQLIATKSKSITSPWWDHQEKHTKNARKARMYEHRTLWLPRYVTVHSPSSFISSDSPSSLSYLLYNKHDKRSFYVSRRLLLLLPATYSLL